MQSQGPEEAEESAEEDQPLRQRRQRRQRPALQPQEADQDGAGDVVPACEFLISREISRVILQPASCSLLRMLGVSQEHQNFPQDAAEPTEPSDLPAKPEELQYTIEFTTDGPTDGEPGVCCQRKRKFTCCQMQIDLMG